MTIVQQMLAELEQEAQTTRRVFERIPEAHLSWKPHAKSMSLGQLALHVATVPGNVAELAAMSSVPAPPVFVQPPATTVRELGPALDDSLARARRALGGLDDDAMRETWRLMSGDRELMALPRAAFLRAMLVTGVTTGGSYWSALRLLYVPVPSVYGPTARENPFAAPAEPPRMGPRVQTAVARRQRDRWTPRRAIIRRRARALSHSTGLCRMASRSRLARVRVTSTSSRRSGCDEGSDRSGDP